MYDDIGGKIKSLAKALALVEAVVSVIVGIAIMVSGKLVYLGLILLIVGPIVAWISSWLLYGFGQLIENSDIIADEFCDTVAQMRVEKDTNFPKTHIPRSLR